MISDWEKEVITGMATFKGEHVLENRAASKQDNLEMLIQAQRG